MFAAIVALLTCGVFIAYTAVLALRVPDMVQVLTPPTVVRFGAMVTLWMVLGGLALAARGWAS